MIIMKRFAWALVLGLLFLTYYLSSIPGLKVVPIFRQVNYLLGKLDLSITVLAGKIVARLPEQFGPAKSAAAEFYEYLLTNPETMEFLLRKSGHVALFFIITVAVFMLLRQYLRSPWSALGGAVLLGSLMAILDEYYQSFIPGRMGSLADVFVNLVGITLATLFIVLALLITWHRSGSSAAE